MRGNNRQHELRNMKEKVILNKGMITPCQSMNRHYITM